MKPTWLLPGAELIVALSVSRTSTRGEPDHGAKKQARWQRWYLRKGLEYYRNRRKNDPAFVAVSNARTKSWSESEKGRAWREANRERRNAYYRLRYQVIPGRRDYLNAKQREYRARSKLLAIA